MGIWFVSRHNGAVAWAKKQGIQVDHWISHFDAEKIAAGDTVIGILPVNLAEIVCSRGARYFHLSLNLPKSMRNKELSEAELVEFGAKLEEFIVTARGNLYAKI